MPDHVPHPVPLAMCVERYVTHRRALGVGFAGDAVRLNTFVRRLHQALGGGVHVHEVTAEAVRAYLDGTGPITSYWHTKYHTLTGLFRFALAHGHTTRSPLPLTRPAVTRNFIPYIFNHDEIARLLIAADQRIDDACLVTPATFRVLVLLLLGTGLRIGEAVRLRRGDFDVQERLLRIEQTKFYKDRLVPVGDDVHRLLVEHLRHQDQRLQEQRTDGNKTRGAYHKRMQGTPKPDGPLTREQAPLLADRHGGFVLRQTAELVFKRVREHVGLTRPPEYKFFPRLHDLRHSFAVHRLVSWYRQGQNVQRLLPHLSTYLGHRSVRETQRYLTLTSDVAHEAGLKFLSYALPPDQVTGATAEQEVE